MTWTAASASRRPGTGGVTSVGPDGGGGAAVPESGGGAADMTPTLLALPAHVGVRRRLGDEVRHDLAELGRVPAVALVGGRALDPALGHAEVVALHVEDAARDAGRFGAAEPHDDGG